jgi:hypothetical protein
MCSILDVVSANACSPHWSLDGFDVAAATVVTVVQRGLDAFEQEVCQEAITRLFLFFLFPALPKASVVLLEIEGAPPTASATFTLTSILV